MTDPDWQRLGELVVRRREELGLTQADVQAAGGPSSATVRNIEYAEKTSYRSSVLRRLERALQWESGAVDVILAGGEPVPARPGVRPRSTDIAEREADLIEIVKDERWSPGIRAWAQTLLDQLENFHAAADEERRRAG